MTVRYILDCGSRSIKLHDAMATGGTLRASRAWEPLLALPEPAAVARLLDEVTAAVPSGASVCAVGTAAARRDPRLAEALGAACSARGWPYRTLSQTAEAELIRCAFAGFEDCDIVNAGGGSIQIVRPIGPPVLLPFGITDLNARFALDDAPERRRIGAATAFVEGVLPELPRPFLYCGGELSYLEALGASLDAAGRCPRQEFDRVAALVDQWPLRRLQEVSGLDPGWVRGAAASNAIVRACFARSGRSFYFASDINIADGLMRGLSRMGDDAPNAGL